MNTMDSLFASLGLNAPKATSAPARLPQLSTGIYSDHDEDAPTPPRRTNPEDLLEGLNPEQAAAVEHTGAPLLVIAGAGSGKTRVLTHRIAYLIATGQARPSEILAITFTNKAAAEMRERVSNLVGPAANYMWVSTFHSACVRILRQHANAAGLKTTFTIYDQADAQRLVTLICKELNLDPKQFPPKSFAFKISDLKNDLISPEGYEASAAKDPQSQALIKIYATYQQRLRDANAVDFDDLIMLSVKLLREHPAIAEHYHRRFRHILVDEYQDTNHAQYELVRVLVGNGKDLEPAQLTVVGDSDQSIYAFRGATIRNIEEFEKDFKDARTITLEQNYRSTQNILSAANAIIAANQGRRAKNLWTAHGDGAKIVTDAAESDRDEANFLITEIDALRAQGRTYGDVAVFYRTNAQSRALEDALVKNGIPYRVIGGTRFYDRKEIKDAIAYLHVLENPDDTVSILRIINTPRRGIGDKTIATLNAYAQRVGVSLGAALSRLVLSDLPVVAEDAPSEEEKPAEKTPKVTNADYPDAAKLHALLNRIWPELATLPPFNDLSARVTKTLREFWLQILRLNPEESAPIAPLLDQILDDSGYLAALRASTDLQDASRVDNLAELHAVALEFDQNPPAREENQSTLGAFLESVALVADADQLEHDEEGQVTLMTVHTAKGLEFPVVFVTGMEDGTFPHSRSLEDPNELSEERRLAYVAVTRAREQLYLTRAGSRSSWGTPQMLPASRFLADIPAEVQEARRATTFSEQSFQQGSAGYGYGSGYGSGRGGYGSGGYGSGRYGRGYGDDSYSGNYSSSDYGDDTDFAPAYGSGRARPMPDLSRRAEPTMGATARARAAAKAAKKASEKQSSQTRFHYGIKPADRIEHPTFGTGIVMDVTGSGEAEIAEVTFDDGKHKRLMLRFAKVKKI
nr:UvrD-helicase domain-containing protein [Boudabousia liubingyangii]